MAPKRHLEYIELEDGTAIADPDPDVNWKIVRQVVLALFAVALFALAGTVYIVGESITG